MPEQDFMFQPEGEKKKSSGLFKQHPKESIAGPSIKDVAEQTTNLGRRLRTLEERYTNMQSKTQLTEQNLMSRNKHLTSEIKTITSDINEMKKEMNEIKERILSIINELKATAKKEEIKILEKYINLWEPLNFVTRTELKEVIREMMNNPE